MCTMYCCYVRWTRQSLLSEDQFIIVVTNVYNVLHVMYGGQGKAYCQSRRPDWLRRPVHYSSNQCVQCIACYVRWTRQSLLSEAEEGQADSEDQFDGVPDLHAAGFRRQIFPERKREQQCQNLTEEKVHLQKQTHGIHIRCMYNVKQRKEGHFYLTTYSTHFIYSYMAVGHMVKDHSDSERGNLLLPHGLLFPISSKGSFICTIPQTG